MIVKGINLHRGMKIRWGDPTNPPLYHEIISLRPFKVRSSQQGKQWETWWTPTEYAEALKEAQAGEAKAE